MAQKKKASGARQKVAGRGKGPQRSKVAVTGASLRRVAKQADILVLRTAQEYVDTSAELEAARRKRRDAERDLGAYHAAEAKRAGRPFYNFLAQGDSWFDYTCGVAIINWLQRAFGYENAYFDNIAFSGRTLRQMLSSDFKDRLAAGPPNGQPD